MVVSVAYYMHSCCAATFADYDVDGGQDLDIFDINEGMPQGGRSDFFSSSRQIIQVISFVLRLHRGRVESCGGGHCA